METTKETTIACISDTHGMHKSVRIPPVDILIHAGDVSARGSYAEISNFIAWFNKQPAKYKVFIAGNHDFAFQQCDFEVFFANLLKENTFYLQDSSIILDGIKIYGSPWQPWFYDWAFNRSRGEELAKIWALIPEDTDILVTHGPAYQHCDKTQDGYYVGCGDLLRKMRTLNKLRYHVCGHIHEAYGHTQLEKDNPLAHGTGIINVVRVINASTCTRSYKPTNKPIFINYYHH